MKNWIYVLLYTVIIFSAFFATIHVKKAKLAWVDLPKLYAAFDYKKEQEKSLLKIRENRKTQLDSLEFELKLLAKKIKSEKGKNRQDIDVFQLKKETYLDKKRNFTDEDASILTNMEDQILIQLNQYVKDYGKEHSYDIILGAEGSGSVMYANDDNNITSEVQLYVNNKFKGVN